MRTLERTREFASVEVAPSPSADVLGTNQTTTSYGSDNKSSQNLIGMTENESVDMMPPMRFMTFDQMRREDAAVKSALWLITQPIRSASWSIVPASEDPGDKIVADALRWQFGIEGKPGIMDLSWREQMAQKMLMLVYGSMFEEILVADPDIFYDADGDPHIIRPFGRLAPRFPQSIRFPDGIKTDTRTGLIKSFVQWVPDAKPIPGEKLIAYVHEKEGNDWLGTSLLRPMYGSWKLKRAVMISAGIGWDRFAFGTPVVRYPKGGGFMRKKEAENIGRNWRGHERGYFVLEGTAAQGWDVSIEGNGQMSDPTPLIHAYDEQIAAAALQHFIVLGRGSSGGNRALGDALSEPYYMFLSAIADDIAEITMKQVFRKWITMNFGPQYEVPQLIASRIASRNIAVLAAAIAALADAGFYFTDPDTQNDVRGEMDLRGLPEQIEAHMQAVIEGDPGAGIAVTSNGGPAVPIPAQRQPLPGATDATGRPALSEGDGLGYQ